MKAKIGFRRACKELEIRFDIKIFDYDYYRAKYIEFCYFLTKALNENLTGIATINMWYFDNLVNSKLPHCLTHRDKISAVKSFFEWIHDDIAIQNNNQSITIK